MLRARLGTHSGAIKDIFSPYHVNVDATTLSEISEDIITRTVSKASGTAVHVLEKSAGSSSPSTSSPSYRAGSSPAGAVKGVSGVPKPTDNVKFGDESRLNKLFKM